MLNAKELLNERLGKESEFISNVEAHAICKKLRELGVEVIEVFPDKIEFDWLYHICSYKNRTFYCGSNCMLTIENISDLNTNSLNCLVGKLTDEQLNRVGILIDLFEDKRNHLLSQREDMKSVEMEGTKLYLKNEKVLNDTLKTLMKLRKVFQSGFVDSSIKRDILCYILNKE